MGWRYIGSALPAASTTDAYLDTIVALFASATYADTTARTAGVGYAWSLESSEGTPLEAISLQGPTGCGHTARVVIVGDESKVPNAVAMAAPDSTGAINILHVMTSVGGTLSTWDGLTPMGGGTRITMFDKAGIAVTGAAGPVRAWESPKGVCIVYKNGTSFSGLIHGAWLRPFNTAGALGAEPDGHLYGGFSSGSGGAMYIDEDGSTYDQNFGCMHVNNAVRAHGRILLPGSTSTALLKASYNSSAPADANSHKTLDGEWIREKIFYKGYSSNTMYCYSYDMGFVPRDLLGVTRYDGVNPSYYTISATDAAIGDAIGLFYDET